MKLHKIKSLNSKYDTETCVCINNFLWNKSKIKILNDKEFLAPKYYCPRHIGQLEAMKRAGKRYRARNPLKFIKQQHESKAEKKRKNSLKYKRQTERNYKFCVQVTYNEYEALWNYLYRDLRNPLERKKLRTAREVEIERLRKEAKKK